MKQRKQRKAIPIKSISRCKTFLRKLYTQDKILLSLFNSDSISLKDFMAGHIILCTRPSLKGYADREIGIGTNLFRAYITHPLLSFELFKNFASKKMNILNQSNLEDLLLLRKDCLTEEILLSLRKEIQNYHNWRTSRSIPNYRTVDAVIEKARKKKPTYKRQSQILSQFLTQFEEASITLKGDLSLALVDESPQLRELTLLLQREDSNDTLASADSL